MGQQQLIRTRAKPRYLEVRNWERFQHYRNRKPIWIKFYVETLDDTELRQLPYATRLLWDQLLLLAARFDNAIPNDPEELSYLTRIDLVSVTEGLEVLLKGAWLRQKRASKPASSVLAEPEQDASPHARPRAREEKEKEKENPQPPFQTDTQTRLAEAFIRNGGYDLTDASLHDEFRKRGIPETEIERLAELAASLRTAA